MRNMNPGIVEIISADVSPIMFKCKKCGQEWSPNIKPVTHKFYRGAWQCPNGCKE
jgi:hypothetical protein